jgi:hypothetical protein
MTDATHCTKPQSPTFVAKFIDGETTRVTVFTRGNKLNVWRGVRLAHAAYRSRTKKEPIAIVEARFERNGAVLAEYSAEQLARFAS